MSHSVYFMHLDVPGMTEEDTVLPIGPDGHEDIFCRGWLVYEDITLSPKFILLYDGRQLTHLVESYDIEDDVLTLFLVDGTEMWTYIDPYRVEIGVSYTAWWQPVLRRYAALEDDGTTNPPR